MQRDISDMLDDLETQIINLQTSLDLQTIITQKYDRIDKADYEKLYDYEQIGILTRILFDRLYSEAQKLDAIFNEIHTAVFKPTSVGGGYKIAAFRIKNPLMSL